MTVDPQNPVVQLCAEGMSLEYKGLFQQAAERFTLAWYRHTNDFEACIAAHYLARHQADPAEALRWNLESLKHANAVRDERVQGFYASLYLNVGKSYEDLDNANEAKRYYKLAASALNAVPPGPYREVVFDGVTRALQRIA